MPNTSSYADVVLDWERLLLAVQDNTDNLPESERLRAALQQHLDETRALKARQVSAAALRQRTTQELKVKLEEGRELAMRLRGTVRAGLGPRNEGLVQFGMAPLRARRRGEKPGEEGPTSPEGPTIPEVPAVTPRPRDPGVN